MLRLAPQVDGVLLVIEDGARSKAELERALAMLESVGARVLGAVLNKRRYDLPGWLYAIVS